MLWIILLSIVALIVCLIYACTCKDYTKLRVVKMLDYYIIQVDTGMWVFNRWETIEHFSDNRPYLTFEGHSTGYLPSKGRFRDPESAVRYMKEILLIMKGGEVIKSS